MTQEFDFDLSKEGNYMYVHYPQLDCWYAFFKENGKPVIRRVPSNDPILAYLD